MTKLLLDDELLDAQLIRAIGATHHQGADIGEVVAAMKGLHEKNLSAWYEAWNSLGERVFGVAADQEHGGHRVSARNAFLRACTYLRTAGSMLYSTPIDERMVHTNTRQTEAFRRAAALLDSPVEIVQIPYEDGTLPGYVFRAPGETGGQRRATVIGLSGYDGTAEECYFYFAAPALARGYNVLIFDGPGQGAALLQQGLTMRPDWDAVITPVVDFLLARGDVDPNRIALAGLSMGGFLGPRAAANEHRLAALIADSGSYDMYAGAVARLPGPLAKGYEADSKTARAALAAILRQLVKKPTAGWGLRRGMVVHGVDSPLAYFDTLRDFRLEQFAPNITCPTLVTHAEGDDIGAGAPQLFRRLTVSDKQLIRFTAAEGGGDHCEAAARTLFDTRAFSWLDERMQPQRAA
jgi:alpha-beta hydrolase superfamily lysophospholipase